MRVFARNEANEKREFLPCAVFSARSFSAACFVGAPLFDFIEAKTRFAERLAIGGNGEMVGKRSGRVLSMAWMGSDWNFHGRHVAVNAARLELFFFVDGPSRLARDAEAGVVEDENELPVVDEVACGILKDGQRIFHVLQSEEDNRMGKRLFLKCKWKAGVLNKECMFGKLPRFGDQAG